MPDDFLNRNRGCADLLLIALAAPVITFLAWLLLMAVFN